MTLTINLPKDLETKLKREAEARALSPEAYALDLLDNALEEEGFPTPKEVVARIKATPPNPASVRRATGSLADALRDAPHDPDFDLEQWQREWDAVEAEMKRITRENDIGEGRG